MDLGILLARLSGPFDTDDSVTAAHEFLALPDPSATLDRSYGFLLWQRTLRQVLSNLARTGFDLELISIRASTFAATFPKGYPPKWAYRLDSDPTARQLCDILERHKELQGIPLTLLTRMGQDEFVAVSGRAYQALYPTYSNRAEFDTDLVAPDLESAMSMVKSLTSSGYGLESVRVRRLGESADASIEVRTEISNHTVSIGILVGGYHSYRNPLLPTAVFVDWVGQRLRVPRPEDLLLMLAARVVRKSKFALVNFNDAAVVLRHDGSSIDWVQLCEHATRFRLEPVLSVLLARGQVLAGEPVVPLQVWDQLQGGGWRRSLSRLSGRIANPVLELGSSRGPADNPHLASRLWVGAVRLRQHRSEHFERVGDVLAARIGRNVYRRQLRQVRAGSGHPRLGRNLRPRCGAFCEISPHLAAGEGCLSQIDGDVPRSWDLEVLEAAGRLLEVPGGRHNCDALRFDLVR